MNENGFSLFYLTDAWNTSETPALDKMTSYYYDIGVTVTADEGTSYMLYVQPVTGYLYASTSEGQVQLVSYQVLSEGACTVSSDENGLQISGEYSDPLPLCEPFTYTTFTVFPEATFSYVNLDNYVNNPTPLSGELAVALQGELVDLGYMVTDGENTYRFCYRVTDGDSNSDIFLYQTDENGQWTNSGDLTLYNVFSLEGQDRDATYSLAVDNGTLVLNVETASEDETTIDMSEAQTYSDEESSSDGEVFSQEETSADQEEISADDGNVTVIPANAETFSMLFTGSYWGVYSTEGEYIAGTDVVAAQTTEATTEVTTEVTTEATTEAITEEIVVADMETADGEDSSVNGWMIGFIIVVVLFVVAAVLAVFGFMGKKKADKAKEEVEKKAKKDLEDLKEKYNGVRELATSRDNENKGNREELKRLRNIEKERDELQTKYNALEEKYKSAYNNSGALANSMSEKTEEIEKLMKEKEKLESDLAERDKQIEAYKAQEKKHKEELTAAAAAAALKEKPWAETISVSTTLADNDPNLEYLSFSSTMSGSLVINVASSFKKAPLVWKDGMAALNPYYFTGLPNNQQSGTALKSLSYIFDMTGYDGEYQNYGLGSITAAEISKSNSGEFELVKKGKLALND